MGQENLLISTGLLYGNTAALLVDGCPYPNMSGQRQRSSALFRCIPSAETGLRMKGLFGNCRSYRLTLDQAHQEELLEYLINNYDDPDDL